MRKIGFNETDRLGKFMSGKRIRPKRTRKTEWIIGILIVAILVFVINSYSNNIEESISSVGDKVNINREEIFEITTIQTPREVSLMSKCKSSFKECQSISNKKYGWSISIINIEEVDNIAATNEFFNVWGGFFEFGKGMTEEDLPSVLISYTIKYPSQDFKLPSTAICNKDGELTKSSKKSLSCG